MGEAPSPELPQQLQGPVWPLNTFTFHPFYLHRCNTANPETNVLAVTLWS